MKHCIYLDHAATTGVRKEVLEAMLPYFSEHPGNPSARYHPGQTARKAITDARERIAALLHAEPEEIFFTSGGSESDNWVIKMCLPGDYRRQPHIITTAIEHPAVKNSCRFLEEHGCAVTWIRPQSDGLLRPNDIATAIRPETVLLSVQYANNEIGTIQPLEEIGAIAKYTSVPLHTDAVQALGQIPIHFDTLPVQYLSASAHKVGGPKGVGLLYCRKGFALPPLIHGGAQEFSRRAGTENVPGIIGFARALELMCAEQQQRFRKLSRLRDDFARFLQQEIPGCRINGTMSPRLPGNLNVTFPGSDGTALLQLLDMRGICVSSGSACASSDPAPSHVLTAIGVSPEDARCTLRFSLGCENTKEELAYTCYILKQAICQLHPM